MKPRTPSLAALVVLIAMLLVSGCERGVFLPWKCSNPAPLEGEWDERSPDRYSVRIADGLDLERVAEEFESEPGIEVTRISPTPQPPLRMTVNMNPVQREVLRCDPRVVRVIHSQLIEWPVLSN